MVSVHLEHHNIKCVVEERGKNKSLVFVTRHRRWCSRVQVPAVLRRTPRRRFSVHAKVFSPSIWRYMKISGHYDSHGSTRTTTAESSFTVCIYSSVHWKKTSLRQENKQTWKSSQQQRRLENSCVSVNVSHWRQAAPDKNEAGWFDATQLKNVFPGGFKVDREKWWKKNNIKQIQIQKSGYIALHSILK